MMRMIEFKISKASLRCIHSLISSAGPCVSTSNRYLWQFFHHHCYITVFFLFAFRIRALTRRRRRCFISSLEWLLTTRSITTTYRPTTTPRSPTLWTRRSLTATPIRSVTCTHIRIRLPPPCSVTRPWATSWWAVSGIRSAWIDDHVCRRLIVLVLWWDTDI